MSGVHSTLNMLVVCPNISFANQSCVAPGLNLQTHTVTLVMLSNVRHIQLVCVTITSRYQLIAHLFRHIWVTACF